MTEPDFNPMSKDEVITWFRTTDDLSPMLRTMTPATEPVQPPATGENVAMMLARIRLPVSLLQQLDSLADAQGARRSEIIRDALNAYVTDRLSPVARDDAERALDVLRRVVASRVERPSQAA